MRIIGIVVGIVLCGAFGVLLAVRLKIKAGEKKKYYKAAQRIIREEYLDGAIRNAENTGLDSNNQRMMIVLKVKGNKGSGYVFDPFSEVFIGRGIDENDICIQDLAVSARHCKIFLYRGQLCIEDLNSSNGTRIKKRWRRSEWLYGRQGFLYNRSKIWVGNNCFRLIVFYCDISSE